MCEAALAAWHCSVKTMYHKLVVCTGGMPPEHQLQVDAVSPGEEAMDASWLTAHSHEAAGKICLKQ